MASIRDIAKRAGVSITTVSRALNNYNDVGAETKQRILDICKEMNYQPNPMAHNLKAKRARNIALILSENKKTDANGNIIYRLLLGIQEECNLNNYDFSIIFTDGRKQTQKTLRELCAERSIGGAVIYGLKNIDPYYTQIRDARIPIACIDFHSDGDKCASVGMDNESAIDALIELFCQRGKRSIGIINGSTDAEITHLRTEAFFKACDSRGIPVRREYVRYADFTMQGAYYETLALVKNNPEIDGIFYASDLMALGGLRALREQGIAVPERIAIAGFDGIEAGGLIQPSITTIWQDFEGKGRCAAHCVIAALEGREYAPVNDIPYVLKKRESL